MMQLDRESVRELGRERRRRIVSMMDVLALGRRFDSDWPNRLLGAETVDIESLERLTACSIRGFYRDFIVVMGVGTGGLDFAGDGSSDVRDILDFYGEVASPNEVAPAGWVLLAYAAGVGYEEMCVSALQEAAPVVEFAGGRAVAQVAPSLEELIRLSVVRTLGLRARFEWVGEYPVISLHSGSSIHVDSLLSRLQAAVGDGERFGWPSQRLMLWDRCGLSVTTDHESAVRCHVYADRRDSESLGRLLELLAMELGTRGPDVRWHRR